MHQIRFRLGLRPRPRWGAHGAPPDLLAGFEEVLLLGEANRIGGKGRAKFGSWLLGDGRPCDFTLSETVRPI